ncbi:uncharacterized protein AKAW2_41323S [Aspergillus luchuensis]|uniref:Similar to An14g07160 n=1 Tax=Aspergillus kawachii TaxID=1069201 RepID=A0A146EZV7_ASPKA|nr:uncharacterized protein AKAW2_41323S [Aspergillus luchuensis]BCR99640.1 hypothetical protein AKAW2_41323S [Aspergillus luchuensis]BCS11932.1 hypothetical protein ALUC_41272S [Aspergillus luchuensis]GAA91357.1 similar to An14g07160 [Aspergillus luchuensis IFO 4308]GAT19091.1 similar to An14g07160 [Aspergillus luchuensis]
MVHIQDLPRELLLQIFSSVAHSNPSNPQDQTTKSPDESAETKSQQPPADRLFPRSPWVAEDEDDETDETDEEDPGNNGKGVSAQTQEIIDLYNLCRVCHLFRGLAQPLLFEHVDLSGFPGDLRNLVSITRAVLRRPSLGEHIRSLSVLPDHNHHVFHKSPQPLTANDRKLFTSSIRDLRLDKEDERDWMTVLKEEEFDYSLMVVLLILKAPNLRMLTLAGGYFAMKPLEQAWKRHPAILSKLEDLWFEGDDLLKGYPLAIYEEMISRLQLRSIDIEEAHLSDDLFPACWTPQSLTMSRIGLHLCHIDAPSVTKLLRACRTVTSFTYDNFTTDPEDQPHNLRPVREPTAPELSAALLPHKDTLEGLTMTWNREPWERENIQDYVARQAKIGPLGDFSVLRRLTVQQAFLPPQPQFPPTLEKLIVEDCNISVRGLAEQLAQERRQGRLPALKSVKMLAVDITDPVKLPGQQIPFGQTPEQCCTSIKDMFKDTSVDFDILPYPDCPQNIAGDSDLDDYSDDDPYDMTDEYGLLGLREGGNSIFQAMLMQAMQAQGDHYMDDEFDE